MTVLLSYGMGVDSTAILVRWLLEPDTRDFPLSELIVLTAQTGDEFKDTGRLVEQYMLPLLREHGVRTVQVARGGLLEAEGIRVLEDSAAPQRCYLDGHYKLSDELLLAGTVPQRRNGQRLCTLKYKGWVLDKWVAENIDGAYRHVIGYNADEGRRAEKDHCYVTELRSAEHPLIEWGWGREQCERYLADTFGEPWLKSCCTYCPFAGGKKEHLVRLRHSPQEAVASLVMEYMALALNPRQGLYNGRTLLEAIGAEPEMASALQHRLERCAWAIYRVRRVYSAPARAVRAVSKIYTGGRDQLSALLHHQASKYSSAVEHQHGIPRYYLERREPDTYPAREHFVVLAPSFANDKVNPRLAKAWADMDLLTGEAA